MSAFDGENRMGVFPEYRVIRVEHDGGNKV